MSKILAPFKEKIAGAPGAAYANGKANLVFGYLDRGMDGRDFLQETGTGDSVPRAGKIDACSLISKEDAESLMGPGAKKVFHSDWNLCFERS